jgi:hypothetical protein
MASNYALHFLLFSLRFLALNRKETKRCAFLTLPRCGARGSTQREFNRKRDLIGSAGLKDLKFSLVRTHGVAVFFLNGSLKRITSL